MDNLKDQLGFQFIKNKLITTCNTILQWARLQAPDLPGMFISCNVETSHFTQVSQQTSAGDWRNITPQSREHDIPAPDNR